MRARERCYRTQCTSFALIVQCSTQIVYKHFPSTHPVCVSQTMQSFLLLACLPFTHFRLFTRSVVMCTCICFQQIIRVLHSTLICLKFIQKKRRRWKRQRKKEIIETVARAAMIEWMNEWLDALHESASEWERDTKWNWELVNECMRA